jgi:hypothetical protein
MVEIRGRYRRYGPDGLLCGVDVTDRGRQLKMASCEEGDIVLEESGKCEHHCEFLMM